jgi:hypothetical protein
MQGTFIMSTTRTYQRYLDTLPLRSRNPVAEKEEVLLPVPLLAQLARPIASLEDVDSLMVELHEARARGCF